MSKVGFKQGVRSQVALLRAFLSAGGIGSQVSESAERCIARIEGAARRGDVAGVKMEVNKIARMFVKQ